MTIRGLLIAIAVEGFVLGACISLPWLIVIPIRTALVFVPQLIAITVCAYLATREWSARRIARRQRRLSRIEHPSEMASPGIWYIEPASGPVDPRGIVFESNPNSST
ncbi:MAG: hypothetical protein ACLQIB_06300 [Isosphaeraceae bacterium]